MKSTAAPKEKFKKSDEELSFQEKLAKSTRMPKPSVPKFETKAQSSWNELGIPSDRVAPGAPNPPESMGDVAKPQAQPKIKSKKKMRHGAY